MTVIAYIKTKEKIYLLTDSMFSNIDLKYDKFTDKMFRKPFLFYDEEKDKYSNYNCVVIAIAGNVGLLSSVNYGFPLPAWNTVDTFESYIITSFIPALKEYLQAQGYVKHIKGGGQIMDGEMFVFYENKIIKIGSDMSAVVTNESEDAIGSGYLICLGSLKTTVKWKNPQKRLKRAFDITAQLDPSVGGKENIKILTENSYHKKGDIKNEI